MADTAATAGPQFANEFRIGQVFSKAFEVFSRHITTFTLIAGVVILPVVIADVMSLGQSPETIGIAGLVGLFLYLFLTPLATATILHGAFQDMRGQTFRLGDSISHAMARFLPLAGLMVIQTIGILLGSMLLIIPGLILSVMWYVSVPVCVVEKMGPIESLNRSQALTKGTRWKLFGMFLLVLIINILANAALPAIGSLVAGIWGYALLSLVAQGLVLAFGSVLIVVAYYYLRSTKEGLDIEALASVFD